MAVDFGLQGQVAIVTGSTSGIGHAMADAWRPRASTSSSTVWAR
jgi:NAD(P)-dependent dehydrogenase (short-subunit alcohol dehydrogenase family)